MAPGDGGQPPLGDAQLRRLVEEAGDLIYRCDLEGNFNYVNPTASRIMGYPPEELLGRHYLTLIHPDYRAAAADTYSRQIAAGVTNSYFEFIAVKKDGSHVWIGQHVQLVLQDGVLTGLQAIARDITQQKANAEQARQAHKMEAVGQLAAGIAHNFNNLLTGIIGCAELVLSRWDAANPDRPDLEAIVNAGREAAALTAQLRAFSRTHVPVPQDVDVGEHVRRMQAVLKRIAGEKVDFRVTVSPSVSTIRIDPSELDQVLTNLVLNARDAVLGLSEGEVSIEVDRVAGDTVEGLTNGDKAPDGEFIRLRVSDNGIGMTAEVQSHLFEPFFSTKEPGQGTGLGLSATHGIVRNSKGYIAARSEAWKGSAFTLYFPALHVRVEAPRPPVAASAPRASADALETVLVVDDEDSVRMLIARVLKMHGYGVLEASTPFAAEELFNRNVDAVSMLVTDVVMPEMSGPQLATLLTGKRPDLPVLFVSGYAKRDSIASTTDPNAGFISKPFQPSVLAKRVREMLDARLIGSKGANP